MFGELNRGQSDKFNGGVVRDEADSKSVEVDGQDEEFKDFLKMKCSTTPNVETEGTPVPSISSFPASDFMMLADGEEHGNMMTALREVSREL